MLAADIADAVVSRLAADISGHATGGIETSRPSTSEILVDVFRQKDVSGRLRKVVGPAVVQSVAAGYGLLPSVGYQPSAAAVELAMSKPWDPRGLPTLSSQIHGTSEAYRKDLEDALRKSFAQGDSVRQAARAIYDGYQPGLRASGPFAAIIHGPGSPRPELPKVILDGVDAASVLDPANKIKLKQLSARVVAYAEGLQTNGLKAAYMQLGKALETSGAKGLERAVRVATEEKARYHADRIARTTAVGAWDGAFRARINDDPRVVGIKSRTSSAHKIFDICDFYATADLYGMGPGCYPKDRAPACPYHPHCACVRSPIYRRRPSEVPPRDGGPDLEAGKKTLQQMSERERRQLLGATGAKAFGGTGAWDTTLRHWDPGKRPDPALKAAKEIVQHIAPEVKERKYTPANSIEEAERLATAWNLADRVNYRGINLQAANAINKTVLDHLQEFPDLRKNFGWLGSAQERNQAIKAKLRGRYTYNQKVPGAAMALSYSQTNPLLAEFNGIGFNDVYFRGSGAKIEKALAQAGASGWLTSPTIEGVVAHEIGHQLDEIYKLRTDPVVREAWEEAKAYGVKASISGYADRAGITEGIAEGWAEAWTKANPRQFARRLRERIFGIKGPKP